MLAMFEAMFVFESHRKTNNIKHNRTISTKVEHENRFSWRAAACLWAGASGRGFSRGSRGSEERSTSVCAALACRLAMLECPGDRPRSGPQSRIRHHLQ